jgi:arsenical pump membrane protein
MLEILTVISIFFLTVLSIFVNREVLKSKYLSFLNIPYQWSPVAGAVLIYLTTGLGLRDIFTGLLGASISNGAAILGSSGPFSTIILFLSVAFISLSLEASGFFKYLSIKILENVRGSGKELFFAVFWISAFLALFTSNDILILTLTPFLLQFIRLIEIPAVPYLVGEFFAANIFSMVLVIGNETNIIVSAAHNVGFLEQPMYTLLPAIGGGITTILILFKIFEEDIDTQFDTDELPDVSLKRWEILSSSILLCTILSLGILSLHGIPLWHIALIWAGITLLIFGLPDLYRRDELGNSFLNDINSKMPWEVVPFLTGFFLIAHSFSVLGLTAEFGTIMSNLFGSGTLGEILGVGLSSTLAANFVNNIPMTVIFSEAIQNFGDKAAIYGLIIGGNIGANLTPIGALAGIMWMKMVNHRENRITFREFMSYGLKATPLTALISLGIL